MAGLAADSPTRNTHQPLAISSHVRLPESSIGNRQCPVSSLVYAFKVMHRILLAIVTLTPTQYLFAQAASSGEAKKEPHIRIAYTGRLLGYARIPSGQTQRLAACPADDKGDEFTQRQLDQTLSAAPVLVGMGNNFAPELNSRMFAPLNATAGPPELKDRFEWDGGKWVSGHVKDSYTPPVDNVGCYFRRARYDAIVPGKHDFYFGPQRVWHLARILARPGLPGENEKDGRVQMLAANLAIATSAPNANAPLPDYLKKLNYASKFKSSQKVEFALPATVLPYLRRFKLKDARRFIDHQGFHSRADQILAATRILSSSDKTKPLPGEAKQELLVAGAWICNGDKRDPSKLVLPDPPSQQCVKLVQLEDACQSIKGRFDAPCAELNDRNKDVTYVFPDPYTTPVTGGLQAGENYGLCVQLTAAVEKSDKPFTCKTFSVLSPFLQYNMSVTDSARPADWAYVSVQGSDPVAVFGVVDPTIQEHVGALNAAWVNEDQKFDTSLEAIPPSIALEQLLQKCSENRECQTAQKVLLAQMPRAKATELMDAFPDNTFALAISESDYTHDTGREEQNRDITKDDPKRRRLGFVVTPRPVYEPSPDPKLQPRAAVADLRILDQPEKVTRWALTNTLRLGEVYRQSANPVQKGNLLEAVKDTLGRLGVSDQNEDAVSIPDLINNLTLLTLRTKTKADIAMVQKRDVFDAERIALEQLTPSNLQDQLNRILWKGDFAYVVPVTGASIKKILKRSKELDDLDRDALSTELEKGRGSAIAGVVPDPNEKDKYYVNGVPLDDAGLYSIVTTDYLGFGDTGYSDVKDGSVPGAPRLKDITRLESVSGLVCQAIATVKTFDPKLCDPGVDAAGYLDTATQRPPDTTRGYHTLLHYKALAKIFRPPIKALGEKDPNGIVEQHAYWALKLENVDFSYSANWPRDPRHVNDKFAGVPVAAITTGGSSTLQEDYRIRLIREHSRYDWFLLSESNYQRQLIRDKKSFDYVQSQPLNLLAVETGVNPRLFPTTRPSGVRGLLSMRYEQFLTQPDPVVFTFPTPDATPQNLKPTTPAPINANAAPNRKLFGKIGLREDYGDTWIEGGFQLGQVFDAFDSYQFAVGAPCKADAVLTLQACFMKLAGPPSFPLLTTPVLQTRTVYQQGLFLNFNVKFPLWSRKGMFLGVANQGTFYFERPSVDRSVDTRILDILTPSLTIPLWGKLSLKPKVDMFFFENKLTHKSFFAWQPSLALQYQFAWRSGTSWRRSLLYGATLAPPDTGGAKKK